MIRPKGVLILFGVLGLLAFSAGCGGSNDDGPSDEQLQQAREQGAKEAKQQIKEQAKIKALQEQVDALAKEKAKQDQSSEDSSSVAPTNDNGLAGFSACTGGVQAGPNTTCGFAMNVAGEYGSNPGASSIHATSPTTGIDYTLSCAGSSGGTICTGGNNASVFIP